MIPCDCPVIIVTPVYEDNNAARHLFNDIANVFAEGVFMVAVDDGSVHEPLGPELLESAGLNGVVLRLRRNVGHQRAIATGLGYVDKYVADGQIVIVMDSDGEDRPDTITALLQEIERGNVDAVVAKRTYRLERLSFKVFYSVYKGIFNALTGRVINFGNFMALRPHTVRRLVAMSELPVHVAASLLASKARIGVCGIARGARYQGKSKMNFVGLALHGFKGLMVFAEDVMVRVGIACAAIAVLSISGAMATTTLKIIGFATPGWFSVATGILMLLVLQTGTLALLMLMLTGIARGGTVAARNTYDEFIDTILVTSPEGR